MKNLKKLSTLLAIISCIVFCCCIFAGCADSGNKYHAEMDSYAEYLMSKDFLKEHKVYYPYASNAQYFDKNAPKSYTFIIDDEEQFKSIFIQYQGEIDFNSKMVVIYIFNSGIGGPHGLVDLSIEQQHAIIKYKWCGAEEIKYGVGPYQRCLMVVLDKADITSAEFIDVTKR